MHTATRIAALLVMTLLVLPSAGEALTLQEGIAIVSEQGRDISIARSDESAARTAVDLARSPWLPWVDLYGSETWLRYEPQVKTPNGPFPLSQDRYTTFGFRASQLLYDFGKTSSSINAAEQNLKASTVETFRARNLAARDFIDAFFDLLEAQELLKVAEEEVTRYDSHLKDATSRFRAGVVTRNDVLQAEVTVADSQQRHLTAENNLVLRTSRVNSLLMRPLTKDVHPQEVTGTPLGAVTLQDAWTAAEAQNPDLRDMDARIRAKEESISSIRGEYLPQIFVRGGYDYTENEFMVHPDNWSFIAGVNVSLFAGGSTNAKVGVAKNELLSLRMTRDKLLDSVRIETQAAWLEVQSSQKKIQVALSAVSQAQENLRLQQLRYKEGVATTTDVLDAVTLLTTAETNSWKANFALRRAEAALLYAMGRDLAAEYRSTQ